MIVYVLDYMLGDGMTTETAYRPAILDAVRVVAYRDATDDGPEPVLSPNVVVARIEIDQAAFDWILNSPDYGEGAILYDLPNPYKGEDKPDASEYGQRRSYAARLGISNAQFRALFGLQGNPKSRKEGADNLINWVRTLPKGQAKK